MPVHVANYSQRCARNAECSTAKSASDVAEEPLPQNGMQQEAAGYCQSIDLTGHCTLQNTQCNVLSNTRGQAHKGTNRAHPRLERQRRRRRGAATVELGGRAAVAWQRPRWAWWQPQPLAHCAGMSFRRAALAPSACQRLSDAGISLRVVSIHQIDRLQGAVVRSVALGLLLSRPGGVGEQSKEDQSKRWWQPSGDLHITAPLPLAGCTSPLAACSIACLHPSIGAAEHRAASIPGMSR